MKSMILLIIVWDIIVVVIQVTSVFAVQVPVVLDLVDTEINSTSCRTIDTLYENINYKYKSNNSQCLYSYSYNTIQQLLSIQPSNLIADTTTLLSYNYDRITSPVILILSATSNRNNISSPTVDSGKVDGTCIQNCDYYDYDGIHIVINDMKPISEGITFEPIIRNHHSVELTNDVNDENDAQGIIVAEQVETPTNVSQECISQTAYYQHQIINNKVSIDQFPSIVYLNDNDNDYETNTTTTNNRHDWTIRIINVDVDDSKYHMEKENLLQTIDYIDDDQIERMKWYDPYDDLYDNDKYYDDKYRFKNKVSTRECDNAVKDDDTNSCNIQQIPKLCIRPKWSFTINPTCNTVHETTDIVERINQQKIQHQEFQSNPTRNIPKTIIQYLGSGYYRDAWLLLASSELNNTNNKCSKRTTNSGQYYVMKSLQIRHDYTIQRIQEISNEVYIINELDSSITSRIYNYCGTTTIVERGYPITQSIVAKNTVLDTISPSLVDTHFYPTFYEQYVQYIQQYRGRIDQRILDVIEQHQQQQTHKINTTNQHSKKDDNVAISSMADNNIDNNTTDSTSTSTKTKLPYYFNNYTIDEKLYLAIEITKSIVAMHNFDKGIIVHDDVHIDQYLWIPHDDDNDDNNNNDSCTNDNVQDDNDIITSLGGIQNGRIVLNDMNLAQFLPYDVHSKSYCKYYSAYGGHHRSPEQYSTTPYVDELADVYSLGNIFFSILSGLMPYYNITDDIIIRQYIVNGSIPYLHPFFGHRRRTSIGDDSVPYGMIEESSNNITTQSFSSNTNYIQQRIVQIMDRCYELSLDLRPSADEVLHFLQETKENFERQ